MQPPFRSKHHADISTQKPFISVQTMSIHSKIFKFKIQDITLIRKTPGDATAERGARFHPTVGSATPNGFTTSHPRARPRCLRLSVSVLQRSRTKVTLLLLCYHSLCILFQSSSDLFLRSLPRVPPSTPFTCLFFSGEVACGTNFPAVVRSEASTDGRFTPIPH
jgi:hypothetical protein